MAATVANKACLIVIDGWGISPEENGNAIVHAKTPVMTRLATEYPHVPLEAAGLAVGLPAGLMGNSEVGHMNVGAGRVVYQDIVRIELDIERGRFAENPRLVAAFNRAKQGNGRLHLLGLVSDGGVHSHINHLYAFLAAAKAANVAQTFVQFFADGRDTSPMSGVSFIESLLAKLRELNYGKLATIMGRYYAMDRDKRWERIKIAFDGLVSGEGEHVSEDKLIERVKELYANNETDEFLKPLIVNEAGLIQDGDTLVFINFRSDRMREIAESFGVKAPFEPKRTPADLHITTMTQYKAEYPFPQLFPPQSLGDVLSEWLAKKSILQYHVAETEKYAHVTFFFNGGREQSFEGEDRKVVPSPKVATYDLQPEMNADGVATEVVAGIESGKYPFVLCNFAPPDMVGHTGKFEQAVKGVEATDAAIGRIFEACEKHGYILFITADHGNAEKMLDGKGGAHTAHTTNPVPFIITDKSRKLLPNPPVGRDGPANFALCDVAPTVLNVMGLDTPAEMTGHSVFA